MRKLLLALLSIALFSCDATVSSTETRDAEGTVALQFNLGTVGYLGRSASMSPRRLLLAFRSENGTTLRDTVPMAGATPPALSYRLARGDTWTFDFSILDQNDSLLYAGTKDFRVSDSTLQVLTISTEARYSSLHLVFPVRDSLSRITARVDGAVLGDSSLVPGPHSNDTFRLERDYLPASAEGVRHHFDLQVRGVRKGVDTLLYRLDTVLSIHSGWKEGFALKMHWVGPDTSSPTLEELRLALGAVGKATIVASYGDEAMPDVKTNFGIPWAQAEYGVLRDLRDGATYRTVSIHGRTWMAEDLRFAGPTGELGRCVADHPDSCLKYGRMYRWSEALGLAGSYDSARRDTSGAPLSRTSGVCPAGWAVPTLQEVLSLLGPQEVAGQLKSKTGWKDPRADLPGSGSDAFGFRALPAGSIDRNGKASTGTIFLMQTATEMDARSVGVQVISASKSSWASGSSSKTSSLPVRCVQLP